MRHPVLEHAHPRAGRDRGRTSLSIGRLEVRTLLLIAVAAWLVAVLATALAPDGIETDSSDYQDFYRPVADRLVDGHGLTMPDGEVAARYPPGYPLLLAGTSVVADIVHVDRDTLDDAVGPLLFAAAAAAFAVVATALIGVRRGLAATAVWVLWPITLGLAIIRSSDMPFTLATLVATGLAIRTMRRPTPSSAALLGLGAVTGLTLLIRPTGLAVVIGATVALVAATRWRSLLVTVGAGLVVAPWVLGASLAAHEVVPVSTGGMLSVADGMTFGVDPGEGDLPLTDGMRDLMADAESRGTQLVEAHEFRDFVGDQVRDRPGTAVLFVAYKGARAWYGTESIRYEPVLLLAALVLVPVAGVGLWRWRRSPTLRPVVVLFLTTLVVTWWMTVVTLSIHRYLAPMAGLLLIPAVDQVSQWLARRPAG